jgi:hypothetical protein
MKTDQEYAIEIARTFGYAQHYLDVDNETAQLLNCTIAIVREIRNESIKGAPRVMHERDAKRWHAADVVLQVRPNLPSRVVKNKYGVPDSELPAEEYRYLVEDDKAVAAPIPSLSLFCIPMILTCPSCGARHIDEGEFATKPHHTHSCQSCGLTWRPAVVPTVGVRFLPGFKSEPGE